MIDYDKIMENKDLWKNVAEVSFEDVKKFMKQAIIEAIPVILQEFKNKAEVDCQLFGNAQYAEKDQIEVYFIDGSVDKIAQELIQQFENQ